MKNFLLCRLLCLLLPLGFTVQRAAAVPGELDFAFNVTGTVTLPTVNGASDLAVQPDGRVVTCGIEYPDPGGITSFQVPLIAVRRFNADGTPDTTFGASGRVVITAPYNTVAAVFASFFNPVVNHQGTILFLATLRGAGVTAATNTGLWTRQAMQTIPRAVAREGNLTGARTAQFCREWSGRSFRRMCCPTARMQVPSSSHKSAGRA